MDVKKWISIFFTTLAKKNGCCLVIFVISIFYFQKKWISIFVCLRQRGVIQHQNVVSGSPLFSLLEYRVKIKLTIVVNFGYNYQKQSFFTLWDKPVKFLLFTALRGSKLKIAILTRPQNTICGVPTKVFLCLQSTCPSSRRDFFNRIRDPSRKSCKNKNLVHTKDLCSIQQ